MRTLFLVLLVISISSSAPSDQQSWRVKDIFFVGNNSFDPQTLTDQIYHQPSKLFSKTEFNQDKLNKDIDLLKNFYRNRGFFSTQISSALQFDSSKWFVSIFFIVQEGIRTELDSTEFIGNVIYSDSQLSSIINLQPGQVLDSAHSIGSQYSLLQFLASQGRLFARVEFFLQFDSTGKSADLTFTIYEGPVVKAGTVNILGADRIRPETITRVLQFDSSEILTPQKIRSSITNLYATGLFNLINILPLDTLTLPPESDTVTAPILIEAEESNFLNISFGGGYNSIYKWFGDIRLLYKNLFGLGHQISLSSKISSIILRAQVSYAYPWLFGKDLLGEASAYIEKEDMESFTSLYEGGELAVNGNFNSSNRYRLWSNFKHIDYFNTGNQQPSPEKSNTLIWGGRFTLDTRGDLVDLQSSFYGFVSAELAGAFFTWSNQFYRIKSDIRAYTTIFNKQLNLSTAFFIGYVDNFGRSKLVPPSELLRIGIDDVRPVRGYQESDLSPVNSDNEALGGKLSMVFNIINLRLPVYSFISGEVFMDGGYTWSDWKSLSIQDLKWSVGPGLILDLPAGIFRIDYGFKLNTTSESHSGWYFGLGYAF